MRGRQAGGMPQTHTELGTVVPVYVSNESMEAEKSLEAHGPVSLAYAAVNNKDRLHETR